MSSLDIKGLNKKVISQKYSKPKLGGISSLNLASRKLHFGEPKITQNSIEIKKNISNNNDDSEKIKIRISSPTIKKNIIKSNLDEKRLVQETDINILLSRGEFSSEAISFIPYGIGLLNAKEALQKINENYEEFKILQENYLTMDNLKFILNKIDKIYDFNDSQKIALKDFYFSIYKKMQNKSQKIAKANEILQKIKSSQFRTKLGEEVQRMAKNGDLYKYYNDFELIEDNVKKSFISNILNIDYYIIKKSKELIIFNQNDVNFRYKEIIDFYEVISKRNILMNNFHSQTEHLLSQKKVANEYEEDAKDMLSYLNNITKNYSRRGKFGRSIDKSSLLLNHLKEHYFREITLIIEPVLIKLERVIIDLNTGNYKTIDSIKNRINSIDLKTLENKCHKIYEKIIGQILK